MKTDKEVILEAIKTMQAAKKSAKIFPTGISSQEVFTHLGCKISYHIIVEIMEQLVLEGEIKLYPTMRGKRALALADYAMSR